MTMTKDYLRCKIFFIALLTPLCAGAFCSLSDDPLAGVNVKPLITGIRTASLEIAIKIDPPIGANPLNVNFSAKALKGKAQSFLWDFGDGDKCRGKDCSHIYEEPGTYIARLIVEGEFREAATKKFTVFIKEKAKEKH
jgi:hypothetical protein